MQTYENDFVQKVTLTSLAPNINHEIKNLCKRLEDKDNRIIKVVACRNQDRFDLTVISDDPRQIKDFVVKECEEYEQHLNIEVRKIADEDLRVIDSDVFKECIASDTFFKDMKETNPIISINAERIYADGQIVNSMIYSPLRSVGYMAKNHKMIKEPCIVVYVYVKFDKGRVPMGCIKIPERIDGIRTDIREGMTECWTELHPADFHDPVTVGCQISPPAPLKRSGTMGPIINMGSGKVGFITSLHNLLQKHEYGEFCKEAKDLEDLNRSVHQPEDNCTQWENKTKVGQLVLLNSDFSNDPGYEVAAVELEERIPNKGGFPSGALSSYTKEHPMEYTCGETIEIEFDEHKRGLLLEKVGFVTNYTTGTITGMGTVWLSFYGDKQYQLKGQIMVKATAKDEIFAKPGDSGSLVLMKDEGGELKAFGIVTGGNKFTGVCFVTPIRPICDALFKKDWSLMKFQKQGNNNDKTEPMDTSD